MPHVRTGAGTETDTEFTAASRDKSGLAQSVSIPANGVTLTGDLHLPAGAVGIVLFAHGSGSGRHSPRNKRVAEILREGSTATLLFDLLSLEEEKEDRFSGRFRFNVALLAKRLLAATGWIASHRSTQHLGLGYFGSSTGAGAALIAAAELGPTVDAVVSRGGRTDLAGPFLGAVEAPTLLLVGDNDPDILAINRTTAAQLRCPHELSIIRGASHLFEEPGTLEAAAREAAGWFRRHLQPR